MGCFPGGFAEDNEDCSPRLQVQGHGDAAVGDGVDGRGDLAGLGVPQLGSSAVDAEGSVEGWKVESLSLRLLIK
jgi:hypothetical protein